MVWHIMKTGRFMLVQMGGTDSLSIKSLELRKCYHTAFWRWKVRIYLVIVTAVTFKQSPPSSLTEDLGML